MEKLFNPNTIYRSIGILLENFNSCENEQKTLFGDTSRRDKNEKLAKSLDKLEEKFGRNIVTTGFTGNVEYKQDFISKG